jgi:hypothetical protein
MKKLELVERKNTTDKARQSVIEFIQSFDFSNYSDIRYIESKKFNLLFDINGYKNLHDKAYFELTDHGFVISSYDSEIGDTVGFNKRWSKVSEVFDNTCTYIDFPQLVDAMHDFIAKINKATEEKENEIVNFRNFFEEFKSFNETVKQAEDFENNNEEI